MEAFIHTGNPARVIFGSGTLSQVAAEVDRLGLGRVLILATEQQEASAQALAGTLGTASAGVFAGAVMHTPADVTDRAMDIVRERDVDGLIAIGGGSTIGLGKAIAVRTGLPQIVVPTTYAGSEMTPILGETQNGVKTTRSSPEILPEVVIYDVDLTMTLRAGLSATSGMNAIAHAVEALYARDRSPIISIMAVEGIGALVRSLPGIVADPGDREARSGAFYGAWLCGTCLGSVGMALHHKLCHTLGGSFDLPHAETHTIVLPHALAYNAPTVPEAMARLNPILGDDPALALFDLAGRIGAPRGLRDLGMPEQGIDEAARIAMANPYWNPRPLDAGNIRALIARAWAGEPPRQ